MTLTEKQQLVLEYVESYCATEGFPPTTREISANCSLGGATSAHRILRALRASGLVEALPGKSRAIRVVREQVQTVGGPHATLLRSAAVVHGRVRDRALRMAAQIDTPSIKSELIMDCARRDVLVREIMGATVNDDRPDLSSQSCQELLGRLARSLPSTRSWDEFVVDFVAFNTVTEDCARALAARSPQAERCLREIAEVGHVASACGRRWATDLPSYSSDHLTRRANGVRRLCKQAWALAS